MASPDNARLCEYMALNRQLGRAIRDHGIPSPQVDALVKRMEEIIPLPSTHHVVNVYPRESWRGTPVVHEADSRRDLD